MNKIKDGGNLHQDTKIAWLSDSHWVNW